MIFALTSKIVLSLEESQNSSKEMSQSTKLSTAVNKIDKQRQQNFKGAHQSHQQNRNSNPQFHSPLNKKNF